MQNPKSLHVDSVLTNIAVKHDPGIAVWNEVAPRVPVKKKSDVYFVYDAKSRLQLSDNGGLRPSGGYTEEVDFAVSTDDYACKDYAFGRFVDDEEQDNADAPLDPLVDATEDLTDLWNRHQEYRCSQTMFVAASYPTEQKTTLAGTTQWSHADSDPLIAILMARAAIRGKEPNRLLINPDAEIKLLTHAKVLARLTGGAYPGNPANVTLEDLATLIRVEKIIVGRMEYDTTAKKTALTRGYVWGKHALLYYYEAKPGLKKISLGYTMNYNLLGGKEGFRVRKVRDDQRGSGGYKIIVEGATDVHVVSTDMGYFWENAVA